MAKKKKNFLNLNNIKNIITNKKVILIFIILLAILFRLYFNPMDIDDAPITYRYAENIAHGKGFVYNEGEKVLGTTTPLFTLILAGFNYIGFDVFFTSNAIGLISAIISIVLIYLILKDMGHARVGLLAAFFLAIVNDFVIYTMNGMETSFYILLIILSFYLYSKEKYLWCGPIMGLTFLTRPDGLIVAAIIFGHYLFTKRKIPLKMGMVFALTVLPWIIFSWVYFGNFLPQSLVGKQLHTKIEPFFLRILGFFYDRVYLILMPFLLTGILFLIKNKERKLYPLLSWSILYITAYVIVNVDAYAWYFIPMVPVFIILASYGIINFVDIIKKILKNKFVPKLLVMFVCLLILATSILGASHYINKVDSNWRNYRQIGFWLKSNTEEDSSIMIGAIGYIGYYSDRRIIDSAFLVTKIPTKEKVSHQEAAQKAYLKYKPDYIVEKYFNEEYQQADFIKEDYVLLKNFTMRRNYRTEDLRFDVNYNDNWLIYKRKDLK